MSAALGQRRHVGPVAQANHVHRHENVNSQAPVTRSDNPGITRVDMVQQRVKCFIALPASWTDGAGTVPERATTKGVITLRDLRARSSLPADAHNTPALVQVRLSPETRPSRVRRWSIKARSSHAPMNDRPSFRAASAE